MKKGGVTRYQTKSTNGWRIKWRNAQGKQETKLMLNCTKSDALKERMKILVAVELGDHVSKTKVTFNEFAETFLKLKRGTIAESTFDDYYRFFTLPNGNVIQYLGDKLIQKIDTKDCIEVLSQWTSTGKLQMAKHGYTYLNTFFNQALKMGEIDRNPMMPIPKPRPPKPEKKAMSSEEWKKFYNAIDDDWTRVYFRIMIVTGMRKSEMSGLRIRDIDFIGNSVSIQRNYIVRHNRGIYSDTKGHKASNISLDEYTLQLIRAHLNDLQKTAELFDRNSNLDDPLFPRTNHVGLGLNAKPMNPDTWSRRMKKICSRAGIDAYSLHELRHTTATLLIVDAKMDIMTISQRLRHADRGFTLNQYGHLSDSSQEKATDKLAEILNEENPS